MKEDSGAWHDRWYELFLFKIESEKESRVYLFQPTGFWGRIVERDERKDALDKRICGGALDVLLEDGGGRIFPWELV